MTHDASQPKDLTLLRTNRILLTARYLNGIAGGIFVLGMAVLAWIILVGAPGDDERLFKFGVAAAALACVSLMLHFIARSVLGRLGR